MTKKPTVYTPQEILALPMSENDSGADTIGGYFHALLVKLWEDGESFSGKRPFGNSGWDYALYAALVKANAVEGHIETFSEEDGGGEDVDCTDQKHARAIILAALDALFEG